MLCAFLPLPPKVPIGILATSYNGKIILGVEANEQLVPDADGFLDYMLEGYKQMKKEVYRDGEVACIGMSGCPKVTKFLKKHVRGFCACLMVILNCFEYRTIVCHLW